MKGFAGGRGNGGLGEGGFVGIEAAAADSALISGVTNATAGCGGASGHAGVEILGGAEAAENEKRDWKHKPAGIAQIPGDEAMKIIVSKGFPALPASAAEKKK